MASLINDPGGYRRIQVKDGTGVRRTIRLGHVDKRLAQSFKVRIDALEACAAVKHTPDPDTSRWVGSLDDAMHAKLAKAGLVAGRESILLGRIVRAYATRKGLKPESQRKLLDTAGKLIAHFGENINVRAVTAEAAAQWRAKLEAAVSMATVRTHTGNAKSFFRPLVRRKILDSNPFEDLSSGPTPSKVNRYVTPEEAQAIYEACPSWQYRTIFALARWAGLRIRSEGFNLRWRDVNFDKGRMLIHSPKTERFHGHESREVPIFPSLRTALMEALENTKDGEERVVPIHWTGGVPEKMSAIVRAAGVKPWAKLFQTLRSSCEIEWALHFPQYVVSKWIGHSIVISGRHYANVVPEEMYAAAIQAAQQAAQQGSEMRGNSGIVSSGDLRVKSANSRQFQSLPITAGRDALGDEGLEPVPESRAVPAKPLIHKSEAHQTAHCPHCGQPLPAPAPRATGGSSNG